MENDPRLRTLVDAAIALSSELSLDSVLQRIVESAADLADAKYAALGVIAPSRTHLERFVHTGLDEETARTIGGLPRGRGILGVLTSESRPLRLARLQDHPDSVGFPPHHPTMTSFLGVPILLRGVAFGNLYLTEKRTGEFTQEDEDLIGLLASQAAVAIENARLYESATQWSRQLESLTEVGNALALEIELEPLLHLIAERLRELLNARDVFIVIPRRERLMIAAGSGEVARDLAGSELPEQSKTWRVLERRRSERIDSLLDDPEVDQEFARRLGARTGLYVPLISRDRTIGIVVAHDKLSEDARFTDLDLRLAETFASRAAVAVDMSEHVGRDALRRVVEAQEVERRRLARELHDETGQALTSVLLGLKSVDDAKDVEAMRAATADLRELVVGTLHDVRRLAVELRPKALDDFGLVPALERLTTTFTEKTGLSVELQTTFGEERLPAEVETALYRIVQESLTNVVKHARATRVSVLLTRKYDSVTAVIEDDGVGFSPERESTDGVGLLGIRERVGLLDGKVEIESRPDAGTSVVVEVPLR